MAAILGAILSQAVGNYTFLIKLMLQRLIENCEFEQVGLALASLWRCSTFTVQCKKKFSLNISVSC